MPDDKYMDREVRSTAGLRYTNLAQARKTATQAMQPTPAVDRTPLRTTPRRRSRGRH